MHWELNCLWMWMEWNENYFCITSLLWRNSLVFSGFPSQMASIAGHYFLCCWSEKTLNNHVVGDLRCDIHVTIITHLSGMSVADQIKNLKICDITVHCCLQHPELLVASYNANEEAPNEPDGVALIWNLKYKKTTPEYIFHCQVRMIIKLSWLHLSQFYFGLW